MFIEVFPEGHFTHWKKRARVFQHKRIYTDFGWIFLENKRILTKVYEIFGSEMPLGFSNVQTSLKQLPSNTIKETTESRIKIVYVKEFLYEYKQFRK